MFSGSGQSCCESFPIREIVPDIPVAEDRNRTAAIPRLPQAITHQS
jgi:hypothetical protein